MRKVWQAVAVTFIVALMVFSATLYFLPRELNLKSIKLDNQYLPIRRDAIQNGTPENLSGIGLFHSQNVCLN